MILGNNLMNAKEVIEATDPQQHHLVLEWHQFQGLC